jgi:hypothetical protein
MGWSLLWLFLFFWASFKAFGDDIKETMDTFFDGIRKILEAKTNIGAVNALGLIFIFFLSVKFGGGEVPEWMAPKTGDGLSGAYISIRDVGLTATIVLALYLCLKMMRATPD